MCGELHFKVSTLWFLCKAPPSCKSQFNGCLQSDYPHFPTWYESIGACTESQQQCCLTSTVQLWRTHTPALWSCSDIHFEWYEAVRWDNLPCNVSASHCQCSLSFEGPLSSLSRQEGSCDDDSVRDTESEQEGGRASMAHSCELSLLLKEKGENGEFQGERRQ